MQKKITFIQHGCIKLIKNENKYIYKVKKKKKKKKNLLF